MGMNSPDFPTFWEFKIKGVVFKIGAGANHPALNYFAIKSGKFYLPWFTRSFFVNRIE